MHLSLLLQTSCDKLFSFDASFLLFPHGQSLKHIICHIFTTLRVQRVIVAPNVILNKSYSFHELIHFMGMASCGYSRRFNARCYKNSLQSFFQRIYLIHKASISIIIVELYKYKYCFLNGKHLRSKTLFCYDKRLEYAFIFE